MPVVCECGADASSGFWGTGEFAGTCYCELCWASYRISPTSPMHLEKLGEGARGSVFSDGKFAYKLQFAGPEPLSGDVSVSTLNQLSRLDSSYLITIHSREMHWAGDRRKYWVTKMELVPWTLANCLDCDFSEIELARIAREMIAACSDLSAAKLCHRDITPENVGMTAEGQVKLLDFGELRGGSRSCPFATQIGASDRVRKMV